MEDSTGFTIIRTPLSDIREKSPDVAKRLELRGITEVVTLFSVSDTAQVYVWPNGDVVCNHGSQALMHRWLALSHAACGR